MQKIIFVSIILILGLFSLQMQISGQTRSYLVDERESEILDVQPASYHAHPQYKILYIYPVDQEPQVCPKEQEEENIKL
ncbi:hypothetical protein GYB22_05820 [bacterium]|nr:hypothetical protein [bacterium]